MAGSPPIGVGGGPFSQPARGPSSPAAGAQPAEAPAANRGWVPGGSDQSSANDWIIKPGDSEEVKKEKRRKWGVQNILTQLKGMYEKAMEELKKAMQKKS